MQTHITIIGAIFTALGGVGLIVAAIAAVSIAGGGLISGDSEAIAVTSMVSVFVAGLILILSIPFLVGGVGLLRHFEWARIVVLALGCLCLLGIPFGTILGVYTIWALSRPETVALLSVDDPLR